MNNKITVANKIHTNEAIKIIEASVKKLISQPSMSSKLPSILLRGAPGVGKSSIVRHVADELGIGFVDVRLAQLERVDVAGLPSVKDGTTTWNVPSFWPRDPESKGIIFFDEITSAPADVQTSAYSIILDRKIPNSDYKIPDGWYIIAAGNRKDDHAVAKTMSSALANRFMHFDIEDDAEEWSEWAAHNDIHPSVTGYIRYRPMNLLKTVNEDLERGWPSPRSWERVSSIIPLFNDNEDVLRDAVYGLIGPAVGTEFMEFHRINAHFDDTLKLLTDPNAKIEIPEKSDQKYALCSAISYLLWNGVDEADETARINGMYRIAMKMTPDFATLLIKTCLCGNSKVDKLNATIKLSKNPGYKEFAKKFSVEFCKKANLNA